MKCIGYLVPRFPVWSETFVGTEIRAMQRHGHRVVLLSLERPDDNGQPQDRELAAQTHYFDQLAPQSALRGLLQWPADYRRVWHFSRLQQGMSRKSLLFAGTKIAAFFKRHHCEHVHAHFAQSTTAFAIVAGRLMGVPVSFVGHGMDVYASPADLPLKLACSDFAVAPCVDLVSELSALQPAAKVHLLMCGIEPDRFTLPPHRHRHNGRLLFIGRLHPTKGGRELLRALARIPEESRPELDIVGEGPEREPLTALASTLGIADGVRFLGRRSSAWIASEGPTYMGLCAPFRPAANGDRDTGPVVVKEAMAMGLPVVTTHFQGCKEMVTAETGLRVPVGDIDALATAIRHLCALSEPDWQRMGQAARQRVEQCYTADQQAKRLSALIEAA